jgi:hypothetical protein
MKKISHKTIAMLSAGLIGLCGAMNSADAAKHEVELETGLGEFWWGGLSVDGIRCHIREQRS